MPTVSNSDVDVSGNTLVTEENNYTITGAWTFSTAPALATDTVDAITEIASEAEFTPKQVETREERVNLVYGAKVDLMEGWGVALVPGQPAEIIVTAAEPVTRLGASGASTGQALAQNGR